MDKESLRKFYFSQGSSFGNFKTAHDKQSAAGSKRAPTPMSDPVATPGPMMTPAADVSSVSVGQISVSMINQSAVGASPGTPQVVAAVGVAGLRSMKPRLGNKSSVAADATTSDAPRPDAASAEYFEFLKQQQELQTHHNRLDSTLNTLCESRREQQSTLVKLRRQATELLKQIEEGNNWNLRTKYDLKQLARDANLSLQEMELVDDKAPNFDGVKRLESELTRIRTRYTGAPSFTHHQLFVDQAVRRLNLLQKVLTDGNSDSTEVSRIPETLVVHLEKVAALPSIESLVESTEAAIERATFKIEQDRKERALAIEEGEVHVAEKLCYEIMDHHETMLEHVIAKAGTLERAIAENAVLEQVRGAYHAQTYGEFDKIVSRCTKLKVRCEEDIKKMFALREKVEEMETLAATKVLDDRQRNEGLLVDNGKKIDVVFAKMEELERELEALEKERHRLIQQRIAAKDKDEHRRAEFAQFCNVVDQHLQPLERTIRNMDIIDHSVQVVSEFVHAGFKSLEEELAERLALLQDVKLEAHKQHVEVFRGMLLELGEVAYKKERMIEETDRSVQQAHIQQELLAETFNPNAKKFGDVKKRLLATRDDLENDVKELKERAAAALESFTVSENALAAAGIEFVHPITEQEQHTLALRARMVEFKAIAAGHVEGQAILDELSGLKREMHESRREMDAINASTSGTINKTLPLIRAAQKARQA